MAERDAREGLIKQLSEYNRALQAPAEVLERIATLSSPDARAVITGQQPGLLTGPLYTIYKAISAIVLAERLSQDGRRLVPVFWNHSEDHDFGEVDHIHILKENRPVRLEYPPPEPGQGPRSISEVPLDRERLERIIAGIAEATPESEFKGEIIEIVRKLSREANDLGELFSRLMLWLLGKRGLVLIEPRELRELMVPIFARLIEEPEATGRLINEAGGKLRESGRTPLLRQPERFCNFFVDRRRVIYCNGQFSIDGQIFSKGELLGLLREEPHRFSSDVVTRPLIQDWLFPTYAYVAGPHEARYLVQLTEVYRWFALEPPQIVPRHRATLVERRIRRILDRYAPWAELEDYRQPERLMNRIVKETSELGAAFASKREEIARILDELKGYLSRIDPALRRPCEATEAKIAKVLQQLEAKAAKAQREREPFLQEQIYRAANYLFPLGEPQERVLNVMEFLIRHGSALLSWLEERFAGAEPGEDLLIDLPVR